MAQPGRGWLSRAVQWVSFKDPGSVSKTIIVPNATASGSADVPVPIIIVPPVVATASGSAGVPVPILVVAPPFATASGSAGVPVPILVVAPPAASASGLASPPGQNVLVVVPAATASGLAPVPVPEVRVIAPFASASALASPPAIFEAIIVPAATASGLASPPIVHASSTIVCPAASGSGLARPPVIVTIRVIILVAASGSGDARAPSIVKSTAPTAPVALASAAAQPPIPIIAIVVPVASASGLASPPTISKSKTVVCVAATASGVATPLVPILVAFPPAGTASALASPPVPTIIVVVPVNSGSGLASPPSIIKSSITTIPVAMGSGLAPPPLLPGRINVPTATASGLANPPVVITNRKYITVPVALATGLANPPQIGRATGTIIVPSASATGAALAPLTPSRQADLAALAAPFFFIPQRSLPALVHEIEARHGGSRVPILNGWVGTEQANGGYEGSTGRISRDEYLKHQDVYRYGATHRVRQADTGEVIWAGELVDPAIDGDAVILSARGGMHLAEKTFDVLLMQSRDVSLWQATEGAGVTILGDAGGVNNVSIPALGGITFQTAAAGTSDYTLTGGIASFHIPGGDLSRLAFDYTALFVSNASLGNYPVTIFVSVENWENGRNPVFPSNPVLTLDVPIQNPALQGIEVARVDVDLALRGASAGGDSLSGYQLANVGVADDAASAKRWDTVTIQVVGQAELQRFLVYISNIRVNGEVPYQRNRTVQRVAGQDVLQSVFHKFRQGDISSGKDWSFDWPDHWTASDLVSVIAGRLRIPYVFGAQPWGRDGADAIPSMWTDGAYADALDWAALISNWRWLILDNGWGPYIDFGPYSTRVWTNIDRENQFRPVPLERFDRATVEVTHLNGTVGAYTHRVDEPYRLYPSRDYGKLSFPAVIDRQQADDLAERFLRRMSKARMGGNAQTVWLRGRDGVRTAAFTSHAGDVFYDPRTGYRCRVQSMTKTAQGAAMTFESANPVLDRMTARRNVRMGTGVG